MISWKIQRGDKVTKFPAGAVREHFGDVTVILCAGLHWQLHAWFTWGLLPSLSVRRLTPCRSHSHCCYYYTHTHHSVFVSLLDAMCFHSGRVAGSFEMQTLIRNTRTYISEDGGWLRQRSACPHACPIAHPASRLSGLPEQLQLEARISPCASLLGREG